MIELLILALGVSMDTAAVCAAQTVAAGSDRRSQILRMAVTFGIFQSAMALAGWAGGMGLNRIVAAWDHWVAFTLLTIVGLRMIFNREESEHGPPVVSTTALLVLAFATSIDSFAVGLTLPMLPVHPIMAVSIIGIVTFVICLIAGSIGRRLGARFGRTAGIAGGIVLIGIGTHILISHLSG